MTNALQLVRWRRVAALCAVTLLVHYVAAGWVDGGSAPRSPRRESAPVAVSVQLRAPAPMRPDPEASAAVPNPQVQSDNSAAPAAQPPAAAGRYRTNVPPAAQLSYVLVRAGAGGPAETGEALLDWTRTGKGTAGTYRLHYVSSIGLPLPEQLADLASEGRIGLAGIIPRTMTQQRRGRARTATHFAERGNITFSASGRAVPTQAGAQDVATWPLQLAAMARAASGQIGAGVELLVGEERGASVYRFVVLGQEDIVTSVGALVTWRLARMPAPGSYNARLDVWLAPGHEWFPVQLRSTEANGTVTTQTIRKIVVTDAEN